MGAEASVPVPPVKPGFSTMCISFQYTDRVTTLHLDDTGLFAVRKAIEGTWKPGISVEKPKYGLGRSYRLCGYPFSTTSSSVSPQILRMVCQMLQKLYEVGWKITATSDLGRLKDKSTLFFNRCPPELSACPLLCVNLNSSDKLLFVNLPSQLIEPIEETIRSSWPLGIQKKSLTKEMLDVKLFGYPWRTTGQMSIMAKVLLQNIIATLYRYQWILYCNVNLRNNTDSLFFRYDPNVALCEPAQFCTISLNRNDRVRVINASETVIDLIRAVILNTWECGGIQTEKDWNDSWEFKLSGAPWHSTNEESTMARFLVLKILEAMQERGWHNIAGLQISRHATDKSVMVFHKREPKYSPVMCLSLNDVDTFRLINMPDNLVELFKQILFSRWSKGIKQEKEWTISSSRVCEIKLAGRPWSGGQSNDTFHARSFLCNILQEFMERGWTVLLSADVSAKYVHQEYGADYPTDVHSMWFVYDPANCAQVSPRNYRFSIVSAPEQFGMTAMELPPYSPPANFQLAAFGEDWDPNSQTYEPPPSYSEATGLDS